MEKFLRFVLPFVRLLVGQFSPWLVAAFRDFIKELRTKAAATPNEYDDILVELLADLFGVVED
jgi:hypothetical protein